MGVVLLPELVEGRNRKIMPIRQAQGLLFFDFIINDMISTSLLQQLGLHEKAAEVYEAALGLGEASMSELAKKAGLKRPTTYLAVEQLELLGLLSRTLKGKRLHYSAVHPRRLQDMAKLRERRIEEALPELVALYNTPKNKPKIQVFEGLEGMRLLYQELYDSLNNKEEALFFTNIGALLEALPEALRDYKNMLRKLRNPRIRELNYGDTAGERWQKELKRLQGKHHEIRNLPTTFEFGSGDNLIFQNKLVMFSVKKDVFVIVIESEEIVKTYRALFEWAWRMGKEA